VLRNFFAEFKATPVDPLIDRILLDMNNTDVHSEEYQTMMGYLERLYALKAKDRRQPIKLDTILVVAGNLLGIIVIVAYEQRHMMNRNALGQILHPKDQQWIS